MSFHLLKVHYYANMNSLNEYIHWLSIESYVHFPFVYDTKYTFSQRDNTQILTTFFNTVLNHFDTDSIFFDLRLKICRSTQHQQVDDRIIFSICKESKAFEIAEKIFDGSKSTMDPSLFRLLSCLIPPYLYMFYILFQYCLIF